LSRSKRSKGKKKEKLRILRYQSRGEEFALSNVEKGRALANGGKNLSCSDYFDKRERGKGEQ